MESKSSRWSAGPTSNTALTVSTPETATAAAAQAAAAQAAAAQAAAAQAAAAGAAATLARAPASGASDALPAGAFLKPARLHRAAPSLRGDDKREEICCRLSPQELRHACAWLLQFRTMLRSALSNNTLPPSSIQTSYTSFLSGCLSASVVSSSRFSAGPHSFPKDPHGASFLGSSRWHPIIVRPAAAAASPRGAYRKRERRVADAPASAAAPVTATVVAAAKTKEKELSVLKAQLLLLSAAVAPHASSADAVSLQQPRFFEPQATAVSILSATAPPDCAANVNPASAPLADTPAPAAVPATTASAAPAVASAAHPAAVASAAAGAFDGTPSAAEVWGDHPDVHGETLRQQEERHRQELQLQQQQKQGICHGVCCLKCFLHRMSACLSVASCFPSSFNSASASSSRLRSSVEAAAAASAARHSDAESSSCLQVQEAACPSDLLLRLGKRLPPSFAALLAAVRCLALVASTAGAHLVPLRSNSSETTPRLDSSCSSSSAYSGNCSSRGSSSVCDSSSCTCCTSSKTTDVPLSKRSVPPVAPIHFPAVVAAEAAEESSSLRQQQQQLLHPYLPVLLGCCVQQKPVAMLQLLRAVLLLERRNTRYLVEDTMQQRSHDGSGCCSLAVIKDSSNCCRGDHCSNAESSRSTSMSNNSSNATSNGNSSSKVGDVSRATASGNCAACSSCKSSSSSSLCSSNSNSINLMSLMSDEVGDLFSSSCCSSKSSWYEVAATCGGIQQQRGEGVEAAWAAVAEDAAQQQQQGDSPKRKTFTDERREQRPAVTPASMKGQGELVAQLRGLDVAGRETPAHPATAAAAASQPPRCSSPAEAAAQPRGDVRAGVEDEREGERVEVSRRDNLLLKRDACGEDKRRKQIQPKDNCGCVADVAAPEISRFKPPTLLLAINAAICCIFLFQLHAAPPTSSSSSSSKARDNRPQRQQQKQPQQQGQQKLAEQQQTHQQQCEQCPAEQRQQLHCDSADSKGATEDSSSAANTTPASAQAASAVPGKAPAAAAGEGHTSIPFSAATPFASAAATCTITARSSSTATPFSSREGSSALPVLAASISSSAAAASPTALAAARQSKWPSVPSAVITAASLKGRLEKKAASAMHIAGVPSSEDRFQSPQNKTASLAAAGAADSASRDLAGRTACRIFEEFCMHVVLRLLLSPELLRLLFSFILHAQKEGLLPSESTAVPTVTAAAAVETKKLLQSFVAATESARLAVNLYCGTCCCCSDRGSPTEVALQQGAAAAATPTDRPQEDIWLPSTCWCLLHMSLPAAAIPVPPANLHSNTFKATTTSLEDASAVTATAEGAGTTTPHAGAGVESAESDSFRAAASVASDHMSATPSVGSSLDTAAAAAESCFSKRFSLPAALQQRKVPVFAWLLFAAVLYVHHKQWTLRSRTTDSRRRGCGSSSSSSKHRGSHSTQSSSNSSKKTAAFDTAEEVKSVSRSLLRTSGKQRKSLIHPWFSRTSSSLNVFARSRGIDFSGTSLEALLRSPGTDTAQLLLLSSLLIRSSFLLPERLQQQCCSSPAYSSSPSPSSSSISGSASSSFACVRSLSSLPSSSHPCSSFPSSFSSCLRPASSSSSSSRPSIIPDPADTKYPLSTAATAASFLRRCPSSASTCRCKDNSTRRSFFPTRVVKRRRVCPCIHTRGVPRSSVPEQSVRGFIAVAARPTGMHSASQAGAHLSGAVPFIASAAGAAAPLPVDAGLSAATNYPATHYTAALPTEHPTATGSTEIAAATATATTATAATTAKAHSDSAASAAATAPSTHVSSPEEDMTLLSPDLVRRVLDMAFFFLLELPPIR